MAVNRLTRGAIQFADWLEKQPKKQRQERAAEMLGVAQQSVSALARGSLIPSTHRLVEALRKHCGIAPDAWTQLTRFSVPKPTRARRAA